MPDLRALIHTRVCLALQDRHWDYVRNRPVEIAAVPFLSLELNRQTPRWVCGVAPYGRAAHACYCQSQPIP